MIGPILDAIFGKPKTSRRNQAQDNVTRIFTDLLDAIVLNIPPGGILSDSNGTRYYFTGEFHAPGPTDFYLTRAGANIQFNRGSNRHTTPQRIWRLYADPPPRSEYAPPPRPPVDARPAALRLFGFTADPGPAAVRRRYLELCKELHPDRNPDPAAAERMKQVTAAYKELTK